MNIIAVDDEELALATLQDAIREALPSEAPHCFLSVDAALEYANKEPVDVAFLDVKMKGRNGLILAQELKKIRSETNIIFVTGYSDYMEEAFRQHASGYVRKPVRARRILREIENLRHPINEDGKMKKIKVLGPYMFDHVTGRVYYDGKDALLKPREFRLFCLFASNPGIYFTPEEIFKMIWGDDPNGNIHTVTVHVSSIRKKLNMDEDDNPIIRKRRGEGYYLDLGE